MILNLGGGKSKRHMKPSFYMPAGSSFLYAEEEQADGVWNWELAILDSTEITFLRIPPVDVFFVGGGAPGAWGSGDAVGGGGGRGGQLLVWPNITLTENAPYGVTIGGSGQATSAFGATAASGLGSGGGFGAYVQGNTRLQSATPGGDGYLAFVGTGHEDVALLTTLEGICYGAGGGGAVCRSSSGTSSSGDNTSGGSTNTGGYGGTNATTAAGRNGRDGLSHTGAGGGGAAMDGLTGTSGTPGQGGTGIIIIRNAR